MLLTSSNVRICFKLFPKTDFSLLFINILTNTGVSENWWCCTCVTSEVNACVWCSRFEHIREIHPLTVWSRIVMMLVLRVRLPRWSTALLWWTTLIRVRTWSWSVRVSTVEGIGWVETTCWILTLCWVVDSMAIWISSRHYLHGRKKRQHGMLLCRKA